MLKINWFAISIAIGVFAWHSAVAGVTNPDISAIGQVIGQYTNDSAAAVPNKPTLALGEAELALDAALNPYVNGAFVLSLGTKSIEIEEAYASLIRGLPFNLGLKAGKYRLGFGRLNPAHPHSYPFISTPHVMDPGIARLLPGEESFNDVALQASALIPVGESYSLIISADLLQGDSFHPAMHSANFGWLGRIVNSFMIGEITPCEIGLSATQGTNDPVAKTKSAVIGADAKIKSSISPIVKSVFQAELLYKNASNRDSSGGVTAENRMGFYAFTDFQFQGHYNAGVLYEQYQAPGNASDTNIGLKPFVGFSVLEESTMVRLAFEHLFNAGGRPDDTVEMQLLFSMGPHKAHQF